MIKDPPTVLLVEDNPDDEELKIRAFERANLKNPVDVARDGHEALDHLFGTEEQPPKPVPTVVVLDLNLPEMDGLEVLKRIRAEERTRRVPVVILTSSSEDRDLIAGYDLGANSYVRKPIQFDQFATTVAQLGVYWLMIARSRAARHERRPIRGVGKEAVTRGELAPSPMRRTVDPHCAPTRVRVGRRG